MLNNFQNKNQMHPQDLKNLLIFAALSIGLWTLYEAFVLQPAEEALQKKAAIEKQIEEQNPQSIIAEIPTILPRSEVLGEDTRLPISNAHLKGTLTLKGGRIDDLALKGYFETLEKEQNVLLLSPSRTENPRYLEYGWVSGGKDGHAIKTPNAETLWRVQGETNLSPETPITLVWNNGQGVRFEKQISIDDTYMLSVTQRVVNNSGREVTLFPYGLISQTGQPRNMEGSYILHEGPIAWAGEELVELSYSSFEDEPQTELQVNQGWIGITEKYWITTLIPPQGQDVKFRFHHTPNKADKTKGRYQVDYLGAALTLAPGQSGETMGHAFVGAKEVKNLQHYGEDLGIPNFDLAVDFGIFWFMTKPFFHILHFFNAWVGNFGVAIILLTILIRSAVFPLTNASYKSFAKMKKVAPQMTKLREECGDDKAELQKKIIGLYQSEGVNPMAGCVPILLQIPIFFALYKVLFVTIEMRHAPFFGWIDDLSAPDPTTVFNLFGLIPYDVPSFLQIGVFPCLMLLVMLVQKRLNPPPQDQIQRDMMNIFPFVITYILARFASGLVIYWTFSALISVLQQMFIMHRLGVPIHLLGQTEEEKELDKAMDKGPDVHPLVEMAEDEVEEALFGEPGEEDADKGDKSISPPKPKKKKPVKKKKK